ncbi:MAG: hypothetical protein ACRDHP_18625 [Ktedonobacterales bacterium]
MSTDGLIGIVEQIVIDRTSGQLLSLVIRGEETNTEFEMPASHVRRATGNHVYLDVSRAELMNHPEITAPYDPEQYVPVYQGDAMPHGVASRVAAEQETPVITDVEENAAELVAPEMASTPPPEPATRTDERVATTTTPSQPAATGPATDRTAWTPGEGAATEEDTAPTIKLNRAGEASQDAAGWDEAVGAEERPVPLPELSATPETTGPLMGGKPSTGGMGTASSVPASTAPALDTVPTSPNLPPYTTEHAEEATPPAPNVAPTSSKEAELDEGAADPTSAPQTMPVTQAAVTPEATIGIPLEPLAPPPLPRVTPPPQPEALLPAPAPSSQLMTAPSQQLANLREHLPDLLLNMAKAPEMWILAGSLVTGVVGGILARRRGVSPRTAPSIPRSTRRVTRQATRQATRTAGNMLDRAQDRLQDTQSRLATTTGDTLKNAGRTADQTRQRAKKAVKRAARRGRWFRRGLLLGSAGAMLFAPRRGEETRTQLRSTWERLRSRIA